MNWVQIAAFKIKAAAPQDMELIEMERKLETLKLSAPAENRNVKMEFPESLQKILSEKGHL